MSLVPEENDEHYEFMLRDGSGTLLPATVDLVDISYNEFQLTLRWAGGILQSTEGDFFEAFCRIREQLAEQNLMPVCYGASRQVVLSGMGRDMAAGLKVYKAQLGKPTSMKDLVHIFETGEDVEPVSVAEQREFQEQWAESLRQQWLDETKARKKE